MRKATRVDSAGSTTTAVLVVGSAAAGALAYHIWMRSSPRGAKLALQGKSEAPQTGTRVKADVAALADIVHRVSLLAAHLGPRLKELDVNPVIVRAAGEGALAVDARAVWTIME